MIAGKAAHYTLLAALPMALHGFGALWPAMATYIATQVCSGDLSAEPTTMRPCMTACNGCSVLVSVASYDNNANPYDEGTAA